MTDDDIIREAAAQAAWDRTVGLLNKHGYEVVPRTEVDRVQQLLDVLTLEVRSLREQLGLDPNTGKEPESEAADADHNNNPA